MSLFGEKAAVIASGMTCQTAHQIDRHVDLLRQLTRDPSLQVSRGPFDWLMAPPMAAARMLSEQTFFPPLTELNCAKRPVWRRMGVSFWHDFKNADGAYDIAATYARESEKYARRSARLSRLHALQRVIIVTANSQNNFHEFQADLDFFDPRLKRAGMHAMHRAWTRFLGRPVEVMTVTTVGREAHAPPGQPAVHRMAPDASEWKGSADHWTAAFTAHFAPYAIAA